MNQMRFADFTKKNPTCKVLSSNRCPINRHLIIHLYLTEHSNQMRMADISL